VIDSCLKLHGHLCPPEFIPFHETLDRFFKRNFREEIRRLAVDVSDSTSPMRSPTHQYPSTQNILSFSSPDVNRLAPLQVGGPIMPSSTPLSPQSTINESNPAAANSKQTPLQRHLAHLARTGITGVASAPGDMVCNDSMSVESPARNSFIHVGDGNGVLSATSTVQASGASVAPSVSSFSLKGRLSPLGSITFGSRRNGS
jgi:dedicator of cytokinesis protein 3